MVGNNFKPMTSRQAKKAYKARGGVAQLTDLQKRQLERAVELEERASAIREKEERKKENARKKELKDTKTAEMRAKQGLPPVPEPKVAASQPRIMAFLGNHGKKAVQQGKTKQSDNDDHNEDAEDNACDDDEAEDGNELMEQATAIRAFVAEQSQREPTAAEEAEAAEYDLFWDGVRSQVIEKVFEGSPRETSPEVQTRKRRHSATYTRASTLVGRLPGDAVDREVFVDPRELYVPPSQNVLADKRPRSAGHVDVSSWKAEALERARLAPRPLSAVVHGSQLTRDFALPASVELAADSRSTNPIREPWDEEGDMMDINQELAALRESGRLLQEFEKKSRQSSPQPLPPNANRVSPELELIADHLDDWFPDDSQLQLDDVYKPQPVVAQLTSQSMPLRGKEASQPVLDRTQQHFTQDKSSFFNRSKTSQEKDMDLASFFPNDSEIFASQAAAAEPLAQSIGQEASQRNLQVSGEYFGQDITADMFPSDSQALNNTSTTDNAPRDQSEHAVTTAKTMSKQDVDDLLNGITLSQLAAFDEEIEHDQFTSAEPAVANAPADDEFQFSQGLDLTEGEAAELEAEALLTSRAQTPVTPIRHGQTSAPAEPEDEFGEIELTSQELRELP